MDNEGKNRADAGAVDLKEVAHQLRGICGLFNMVGEKVTEDSDADYVFRGAIERIQQLIVAIDEARQGT